MARHTFFYIFFWRARVCWPLLCLCRPFIIFEGYLNSNLESWRRKQRPSNLATHPSYFATHPSNLANNPSKLANHPSNSHILFLESGRQQIPFTVLQAAAYFTVVGHVNLSTMDFFCMKVLIAPTSLKREDLLKVIRVLTAFCSTDAVNCF